MKRRIASAQTTLSVFTIKGSPCNSLDAMRHGRHPHWRVSHRGDPRCLGAARRQLLLPKCHYRRRHLAGGLLGSIPPSAHFIALFLAQVALITSFHGVITPPIE